jgi:2-C-methyl-D-erythritol 4-phosphate cytidylyltransferase
MEMPCSYSDMKIYAIIPSGGSGKRAGSDVPKQYLKFNDKELLAYTIEVFQNCKTVNEIIVAAQKEYFDLIRSIKNKYGFSKISKIVEGGSERQDSVANALKSIAAEDDDIIVVHDAARPLLTQEVLNNSIECALKHGGCVVAIKARDTLIKKTGDSIDYIDRENIYYIQTPQVFRYNILKKSFENAEKTKFLGTDESMILNNADYNFEIVEGKFENFKITTESDLDLFEKIAGST